MQPARSRSTRPCLAVGNGCVRPMFSLNSWSILVPQALMGVATVGLLYATVRRAMNNRTSTHADDDGTTNAVPAPNRSAPAAALLAELSWR